MSIEFSPSETVKRKKHVVEELQEPKEAYSVFGSHNLAGSALSVEVWNVVGWKAERVSLHFDAAVNKTYSISVMKGRGVVTGKNDRLWFWIPTYPQEQILLSQGFYDGTDLAAQVKAQLDASATFSAAAPWTAGYVSATGLFTVTPNAGQVAYYANNPTVPVMRAWSSGGKLIGLTQDVSWAASVTSDTAVPGLGTKFVYSSGTDADTDVMALDTVALTTDNVLVIDVTKAPTTVHYEVVYSLLDV